MRKFGARELLPILTKSIGREIDEAFFDFLGFEHVREIHSLIIENLAISNKSPTNVSSFRSRRISEGFEDEPYREPTHPNIEQFP